jgi:hypothetical protein
MLSSDDTTRNTGAIEKVSRPYNHHDYASERRQQILHQKQTDELPGINNQDVHGRIAWRQFIQLREENKRLRWEVEKHIDAINSIQSMHQEEIEQYESRLDEMKAVQNRTIQDHLELERRYQELYHSFQSAVEEEAQNMVADAARTLELHPLDRAGMTNDAMKTVELHVKQIEEKHTAESLYLLRQAQKKAYQLEHELTEERQQIALERDTMQNMQNSLREQAELRKHMADNRLRVTFISTITLITTALVAMLLVCQLLLLLWLHVPLMLALIVPMLICIVLAALFAYISSTARRLFAIAPPQSVKQKQS